MGYDLFSKQIYSLNSEPFFLYTDANTHTTVTNKKHIGKDMECDTSNQNTKQTLNLKYTSFLHSP